MKKIFTLMTALVMAISLMAIVPGPKKATIRKAVAAETQVYQLVTDANQLAAGMKLVIGCSSQQTVAGLLNGGKFLASVDAVIEDGEVEILSAYEFELGGTAGAWTLTNSEGTIKAKANKSLSLTEGTATWNITIAANGNATIASTTSTYGSIQYNASAPRFLNYASAQTPVQIYTADMTAPRINVSPAVVDFGAILFDEAKEGSMTITVDTANVVEGTLSNTQPKTSYYTIEKNELTYTIKYAFPAGTAFGTYKDTIVFSGTNSEGKIKTVQVPISAKLVDPAGTTINADYCQIQVVGAETDGEYEPTGRYNWVVELYDTKNDQWVIVDLYTTSATAIAGSYDETTGIDVESGYTYAAIVEGDTTYYDATNCAMTIEHLGYNPETELRGYTITLTLVSEDGLFKANFSGEVIQYQYTIDWETWEYIAEQVDVLLEDDPYLEVYGYNFGSKRPSDSKAGNVYLMEYNMNLNEAGLSATLLDETGIFAIDKTQLANDSDELIVSYQLPDQLAFGTYAAKIAFAGTNSKGVTAYDTVSVMLRYVAEDANDYDFTRADGYYYPDYSETGAYNWDLYLSTEDLFDEEGYIKDGVDGAYLYISIYAAKENSLTGTYTIGTDNVDDYYAPYLVIANGDEVSENYLTAGTLTITTENGKYKMVYNVTDESGVTYKGTVYLLFAEALEVAYDEDYEEIITDITKEVNSWASSTALEHVSVAPAMNKMMIRERMMIHRGGQLFDVKGNKIR